MKKLLRILGKIVLLLMAAALALWIADWAIFEVRAARGSGYDSIQVEEYLATSLKGNKEEYDYMGTAQVQCARAIFPRAGDPPCWWQRRHRQQWE